MCRPTLVLLLLGVWVGARGQDCRYVHTLSPPTDTYHRIEIPDGAFRGDLEPSHLRVYARTAAGDTLEVPYVWEPYRQNESRVALEVSSPGKVGASFRYTVEVPRVRPLAEITLDIAETNFDARVRLEGANRLGDWQTVLTDARILAFEHSDDGYAYTSLRFPRSVFAYYRITVSGLDTLTLRGVSARAERVEPARKRFGSRLAAATDREPKRSTFDITLPEARLVDELTFYVAEGTPYARFVEAVALRDSVNPANQRYRAQRLGATTTLLTSGGAQAANFARPLFTKHVRLTVRDGDDQPLAFDSVVVFGPLRHVDARFAEGETFWLAYGCDGVRAPEYDLARRRELIPDSLSTLSAGPQQTVGSARPSDGSWEWQRAWIWVALGVTGSLIAFVAFRLLKA